ncbi:glyoxylase I 4-like [Phragmites australis]|uniref:glyoxylase I 4-like n=1 Tax=Phragmites australis TaxID=29695 RepID=UPI002D790F15|nr:glyoxylase I 4-like [Phragmites australis]
MSSRTSRASACLAEPRPIKPTLTAETEHFLPGTAQQQSSSGKAFAGGRAQASPSPASAYRHSRTSLSVATGGEQQLITAQEPAQKPDYEVVSIHHVGILCENLERSMSFYKDLHGLMVNPARPTDKLPYRGAWLWVGSEMIHLMELPHPDTLTGRPEHGGRDHHTCIAIKDVLKLKEKFEKASIFMNPYFPCLLVIQYTGCD